MSVIEQILIALSLCVDSFVVSSSCTLRNKITYRRGVLLALIFALFQGGFPFLGSCLGVAFVGLVDSVSHYVSFALLFLVGVNMIVESFKDGDDCGCRELKFWTICLLGMATSIDAFAVGLGLGFEYQWTEVLMTVCLIGLMTFLVSMVGVYLGRRKFPIPDKISGIIAGLVLVGLGAKILIEGLVA